MRKKLLLFVSGLLLIGSSCAFAQTNLVPTELEVTISPESPEPYSKVTFRIENYAVDLSSSDIRWFVGGKQAARGVGLVEFSTETLGLGELSRVSVSAVTRDGVTLEKTLSIRPATVDLIWQADSFVHPFYRGKALPSTKDKVNVYAIPHFLDGGRRVDPSLLRYSWSLDFDTKPAASGVGKSSFTTNIRDLIGESRIILEVATVDGRIRAHGSISIAPENTRALVYVLDPLRGVNFNEPIRDRLVLSEEEATLYVQDFFFPKSHDLSYRWSINGKSVPSSSGSPNTLTVRQSGESSGEARISVSVADPFDTLITAAKSFIVEFGGLNNFQ